MTPLKTRTLVIGSFIACLVFLTLVPFFSEQPPVIHTSSNTSLTAFMIKLFPHSALTSMFIPLTMTCETHDCSELTWRDPNSCGADSPNYVCSSFEEYSSCSGFDEFSCSEHSCSWDSEGQICSGEYISGYVCGGGTYQVCSDDSIDCSAPENTNNPDCFMPDPCYIEGTCGDEGNLGDMGDGGQNGSTSTVIGSDNSGSGGTDERKELEALFVDQTSDQVGAFTIFTPDGGSDVHIRAILTLHHEATIRSIRLVHAVRDIWSTDNIASFHYPLVVFSQGTKLFSSFSDSIGSFSAGTHTFELYGQLETNVFYGGDLQITFDDGTVLVDKIGVLETTAQAQAKIRAPILPIASLLSAYIPRTSEDYVSRYSFLSDGSPDISFTLRAIFDAPLTLQSITITSSTPGQRWSSRLLEGYGPLVVTYNGRVLAPEFTTHLGSYPFGTHIFKVYAQNWSAYSALYGAGGTAELRFSDGTRLTSSIVSQESAQQSERAIREQMLASVASFIDTNLTYTPPALFDASAIEDFVRYLYDKYLQRVPDLQGFTFWQSVVRQHTLLLTSENSLQASLAQVESYFFSAAQHERTLREEQAITNTSLLLLYFGTQGISGGSPTFCYDSDGGMNPSLKGTVTSTEIFGSQLTFSDSCSDVSTLYEHSCSQGISHLDVISCSQGCSGGRCTGTDSSLSAAELVPLALANQASGTSLTVCGPFSLRVPRALRASSTYGPYTIDLSVDNDPATSWYGKADDAFPRILDYDFGSQGCMKDIDLYFPSDDVPLFASVSLSDDGTQWTQVISPTQFTSARTIALPFSEVYLARYMRITEYQSARQFGALSEVHVSRADLVPFTSS